MYTDMIAVFEQAQRQKKKHATQARPHAELEAPRRRQAPRLGARGDCARDLRSARLGLWNLIDKCKYLKNSYYCYLELLLLLI